MPHFEWNAKPNETENQNQVKQCTQCICIVLRTTWHLRWYLIGSILSSQRKRIPLMIIFVTDANSENRNAFILSKFLKNSSSCTTPFYQNDLCN